MNKELTDLEICKKIAEIECLNPIIKQPYKGGSTNPDYKFIYIKGFNEKDDSLWGNIFDPLKDDALCFRLMIKYKINIYKKNVYVAQFVERNMIVRVKSDLANKAICLAIIKSKQHE